MGRKYNYPSSYGRHQYFLASDGLLDAFDNLFQVVGIRLSSTGLAFYAAPPIPGIACLAHVISINAVAKVV